MKNPKLYFTVDSKNQILNPLYVISNELSKIFSDKNIIAANKANYNEYTKNFVSCKGNWGEVVWSDSYTWNPVDKVFNFFEINPCTDDDFNEIANYKADFNPSKEYTVESEKKEKVNTGNFTSLINTIKEKYPCPDINSGFYIEEKNWLYLTRNILKHQNTILIGPTGTGKTEIIKRICDALGLDLNIYDMGAMQDPLTDLLGTHRLENGSSTFDYAKFVYDVQKPGVILLDELSRAPLMTNNILFPCLDGRRTLPVEIADSKSERTIKIHPECTFIATANIGIEYAGTNDIDCALLNRFLPIQLDYLPEDIEIKVINIRTSLDIETAKKLVSFTNKVRAEYQNGTLTKSVSTREILACAELIVDGFEIMDAITFVISNKFINNSYNEEYNLIKKMIMGF